MTRRTPPVSDWIIKMSSTDLVLNQSSPSVAQIWMKTKNMTFSFYRETFYSVFSVFISKSHIELCVFV